MLGHCPREQGSNVPAQMRIADTPSGIVNFSSVAGGSIEICGCNTSFFGSQPVRRETPVSG
jgi:hypothetical protein